MTHNMRGHSLWRRFIEGLLEAGRSDLDGWYAFVEKVRRCGSRTMGKAWRDWRGHS